MFRQLTAPQVCLTSGTHPASFGKGWIPCAVLVAGFLAGCEKPEETQKADVVRPVKILRVEPVADRAPLSFPAMIHARQGSELAFNVAGRIAEMPMLEGAVVEEGGVIARLDAADFISRRDAAKAAYELARTEFERIEKLVGRGAVAAAELDRKSAELQTARTELELAENALADTVLRAPFRGVVGKRIIGQFGNIQAKEPVVQFQALKPLDVVIDIPERLMITGRRRRNDAEIRAVVRFPTMNSLELPVTLHELSTKADPVTQTFRVVWTLEDSGDVMVLPGMSATLVARSLEGGADEPDVFLLPPLAVTGSGDETHVWKFDETTGKVSRHGVRVGRLRDGGMEILDGLVTGDQVVVAGISQMVEGLSVRPMTTP